MIIRAGQTKSQSGWISSGVYYKTLAAADTGASSAGPVGGTVSPSSVPGNTQAPISVSISVPSDVSQAGLPFQTIRVAVTGTYEEVDCQENFQVCAKPQAGQTNDYEGHTDQYARWTLQVPGAAEFDGRLVEEVVSESVANDDCYDAVVALGPVPVCEPYGITGGSWYLDPANESVGEDWTGPGVDCIEQYRDLGVVPCTATATQPMSVNCGDGGVMSMFDEDLITIRITDTQVCATKNGASEQCTTF